MERLNDFEKQQKKDAIVEAGFAGREVRVLKKQTLAIIVAVLVFISVGAYAMVREGLDFFRDELDASFIDLVTAPLEPVYVEDLGIRFEIVGVERISDVVLLYMTVQDLNGEGRVSGEIFPDIEIFANNQEVSTGAGEYRPLYFDEDTNTVYFEIKVYVDLNIPIADTFEVAIRCLRGIPQDGNMPPCMLGNWKMEVTPTNTDHPALVLEGIDLPEQGVYIDHMVLVPFGVHVVGTHSFRIGNAWVSDLIDVVIEVNNEPIEMAGGGCGLGLDDFDCFLMVDEPLDIEEVTAVIFNDYRIEVPE